ncbi:restriction endonuclease subunit S [Streptococcus pneumoniae]|uniref:restriction endonuclease subunit S n=1 Tax=Streptococcus pseudopneumoniae TaxID=257758 RepID=UPI003123FA65
MSISKIRFKGFNTSLERKQIGEITTSFSGGTPKSSNKSYYEGDIPFIRSGEVKSKQTELYISDEALQNSSAKMVEKGDVLYALYGAISGEVAISQINGAINQAILAIKPNSGYSSDFIMNYLKKEKDNILEKYLQGGQGNLSAAIVKSIELSLPSQEEQSAIGTLFRTLDDLLSSYKDNLTNYQSLKETMLSKMFSKAEQTVPEIRLDGFEGEWEVVNLGTLIDNYDEIISGESGFPIATSSRKGLYLQNDYFEGGRTGIDLTLDFHRVPMGYVTYRHMSDDSIFKFNKNNFETDVLVSKEYPVFISNGRSDIDFLLYHLNNSRLFLRFSTMQKLGGTRVRLYYKNLITYKLAVPTVKEQQAIGAYFSNLDNLINSYQEKISQLETLKKKLLQDMFI